MKNLFISATFLLTNLSFSLAQWPATYNGTGNAVDEIKAMTVDNAGNVYVTGYSYSGANDNDYITIKYNPAGTQLWLARYNGPGNGSDVPTSIFVDNAGNVYVTGSSDLLTGYFIDNGAATVKYNPNGTQAWVARYDGIIQRSDGGNAVKADAAGNVYVAGFTTVRNGAYTKFDYLTVKYNSSGAQQWSATYNGPANQDDVAIGLGLDGAGNIYVTGTSFAGKDPIGEQDYLTIKYSPAGVQQWTARYNGPVSEPDKATGIVVDNAGNAYVTGYSQGLDLDFATIKYNTSGAQQWVARYNGPANSSDLAYAITLDGAGNVYVAGSDQTTIYNSDYRVVKYNNAGQQLWTARYNGPANDNDEALALDVDNTGNVYLTGYINGTSPSWNIATIKYSSTGAQQWVKTFDGVGHGNDNGNAIKVDGSGNVYVAGGTTAKNGSLDFITLKYSSTGVAVSRSDEEDEATAVIPVTAENMKALVFPNPFRDVLNLRADGAFSDHYTLIVSNVLGQVEKETEIRPANGYINEQLDLRDLQSGIYFLTLNPGNNKQTFRVQKQ